MQPEPYVNILREPLGFWASNCNSENIPDIVHCNGLLRGEDPGKLTFFISKAFSATFIANLDISPQITFLGCSVLTFESYQYKGIFESIKLCTPEQEAIQKQYLDAFTDVIAMVGFSKNEFYTTYFHQPSYAVTFRITEIFEQTPHKGTGNSIFKK
jgi:hypothetical protein